MPVFCPAFPCFEAAAAISGLCIKLIVAFLACDHYFAASARRTQLLMALRAFKVFVLLPLGKFSFGQPKPAANRIPYSQKSGVLPLPCPNIF